VLNQHSLVSLQIIHCNVGLNCFYSFTKVFVITVIHLRFIDILQGSVEVHLQCGGICANHITGNCPQSVHKILKIDQ